MAQPARTATNPNGRFVFDAQAILGSEISFDGQDPTVEAGLSLESRYQIPDTNLSLGFQYMISGNVAGGGRELDLSVGYSQLAPSLQEAVPQDNFTLFPESHQQTTHRFLFGPSYQFTERFNMGLAIGGSVASGTTKLEAQYTNPDSNAAPTDRVKKEVVSELSSTSSSFTGGIKAQYNITDWFSVSAQVLADKNGINPFIGLGFTFDIGVDPRSAEEVKIDRRARIVAASLDAQQKAIEAAKKQIQEQAKALQDQQQKAEEDKRKLEQEKAAAEAKKKKVATGGDASKKDGAVKKKDKPKETDVSAADLDW